MRFLQFLEPLPRCHRQLPIALDAPNVVMLIADTIQAEVDADAAGGTFATHAFGHRQHPFGQHAVGGDGDHFRLTVVVGANDQIIQIIAQKGLATGKGHIKGRLAQAGKDLVPFSHRQIIIRLAPDIAGATFAVTAKADADDNGKGFDRRPAKGAEGPVEW